MTDESWDQLSLIQAYVEGALDLDEAAGRLLPFFRKAGRVYVGTTGAEDGPYAERFRELMAEVRRRIAAESGGPTV
jgi:hypothetical protein